MMFRSARVALLASLLAACGEVSDPDEDSDGGGSAPDDGSSGDDGDDGDDSGDGGDQDEGGGDDLLLIDDLEDGDRDIPANDGRVGTWFIIEDGSGGEVMPSPDFVPTPGGSSDSAFCAGMSGGGYTDWGVHLGLFLQRPSGAPPEVYDVSEHEGVEFRARGNVTMRAMLSMPETRPVEQLGGTCKPGPKRLCGDLHGRSVELTAEWQDYRLPLAEIAQAGWGVEVPFDPTSVMTLQFGISGAEDLAFDICVDDVRFY
jgi:hypothetical protein